MKRIISGLLTVAMLITSPGLVHASNQTTFVHYIYGTREEIENEHNNDWKDYGTKYFYNL